MADEVKISDLTEKTTSMTEADFLLVSESDGIGGYLSKKIKPTIGIAKTYWATVSQVGTAAPTNDAIFGNTLGGSPVWSYFSVGRFRLTLAGAFPVNKVSILLGHSDSTSVFIGYRVDDDTLEFNTANMTGAFANDFLYGSTIKIEILP